DLFQLQNVAPAYQKPKTWVASCLEVRSSAVSGGKSSSCSNAGDAGSCGAAPSTPLQKSSQSSTAYDMICKKPATSERDQQQQHLSLFLDHVEQHILKSPHQELLVSKIGEQKYHVEFKKNYFPSTEQGDVAPVLGVKRYKQQKGQQCAHSA
ncbi:unnamed protein product, partial [Amoebophrya sp. A120]